MRKLYENISIWTNSGPHTGLKSQGYDDVISLFLIKQLKREQLKSSVTLEFKKGLVSLDEVALQKHLIPAHCNNSSPTHTNTTINEEQLQFGKGAGGLQSQHK